MTKFLWQFRELIAVIVGFFVPISIYLIVKLFGFSDLFTFFITFITWIIVSRFLYLRIFR